LLRSIMAPLLPYHKPNRNQGVTGFENRDARMRLREERRLALLLLSRS
jgi:hypothetical protein